MPKPRFSEEITLETSRRLLDHAAANEEDLERKAGFTRARRSEIEVLYEETDALRDATSGEIKLEDLTNKKDHKLGQCVDYCVDVRKRLKLAYGTGSPEHRSFPSKEFEEARKSETRMLSVMEIVLDLVQKHKKQLMERGMTKQEIARGPELRQELREANAVQERQKDLNKAENAHRQRNLILLYEATQEISDSGSLAFKDDPEKRRLFENPWPSTSSSPEEPEEPEEPEDIADPDDENEDETEDRDRKD